MSLVSRLLLPVAWAMVPLVSTWLWVTELSMVLFHADGQPCHLHEHTLLSRLRFVCSDACACIWIPGKQLPCQFSRPRSGHHTADPRHAVVLTDASQCRLSTHVPLASCPLAPSWPVDTLHRLATSRRPLASARPRLAPLPAPRQCTSTFREFPNTLLDTPPPDTLRECLAAD